MAPTYKKSKDVCYEGGGSTLPVTSLTAPASPPGSYSFSSPAGRHHQASSAAAAAAAADQHDDDNSLALLLSLGLAEKGEVEAAAAANQLHKGLAAVQAMQDAQLDSMGSGRIGAFYPSSGGVSSSSGGAHKEEHKAAPSTANNVYDELRARLEMAAEQLLQGRLDGLACDQVSELLLDQQHQIDLLLRGQSSLRGSMNNLRRTTQEKDAKTQQLHHQLEQQHGAALREMEAKLEKAIQQVQQLQQATRDRQQQQAASSQQSLQCATQEAVQQRAKADELQAALDSKEQELRQALQLQELLQAQVEQERAELDAQHASFTQNLKDCQAALAEAKAAQAAAVTSTERALQQLTQQVEEAAVQQQSLTALCEQLQEQVQQASAAAQQMQADTTERQQALTARTEQLQTELEQALAGKQQGSERALQLEQQTHELAEQLKASCAQVQELQAQLVTNTQQQAADCNESAGVKQELLAAVQAKADLTVQLEQANSTIRELQVKHQQAEAALESTKQQQAASAADKLDAQHDQQALQQQLHTLETQQAQGAEQLSKAQAELTEAHAKLEAAEEAAQQSQDKLTAAEAEIQQLQWKLAALQTDLQKAQRSSTITIQQLRGEADAAKQQLAMANKQLAKAEAAAAQEVEVYRQRWQAEFDKRRKLHNQVIELKGNIRVLARIRPMIEKEHSAACGESSPVGEGAVRMGDEETVLLEAAAGQREYIVDRVFGPSDGQLQVYSEVSAIVTSIMDGYSACIMAYGQTGSGKTYTIEGPAADPGINSRALAELFQVAEERAAEVAYTLSASVLEIYQEQIYDLLTGTKDSGDKLDIKEGPSGLWIPNLRIESVSGPEDVAAVLQKGKQNRSTFATNMNEHSSRSHLVLSIYVTAKHLTKGTSWSSKLHLIDLAGSERVSRSGAEGDRLKEAAAINKSLSALGDVVAALQQRSAHVPYRNSKLTRLLEDALGGNSKTLLVVNCSPAAENVGETKCSLEFATRARKVELGAAVNHSASGGSGGGCSSPGSPSTRDRDRDRDSPVFGGLSSSRSFSGINSSGSANGSGGTASSNGSPRISGRFAAPTAASELRQVMSRRAAAANTSTASNSQQKDDKQ